ncbi:MAG TPA: multiheme c-type cytochrome [Polyangiaceae bacterium]|nr:multiheme c-type cytochrome [Polyangiaceae bacterium]
MKRLLYFAAGAAGLLTACGGDDPAAAPSTYTVEKLLKPSTCNECHQDHYKEWSGSMHAFAAKDPLFLAMNKRGQEETKGALGNFCVSCHAPMAVRQAASPDETIDPEGLPEEQSGITCYFCHNVTDVTKDHNNPLVLANDTTMRGGVRDPVQYKAHTAAYSPLHDGTRLSSAPLCGACHDIVVDKHFSGAAEDVPLERTFAEWKESIFADPHSQGQSCAGCHMDPDPRGTVPIASPPGPHPIMTPRNRHVHDFPAVDTAFAVADFPEREGQHARVQYKLDQEPRFQVCVDPIQGIVTVQVENLSAGHGFPSGASQDRRLWLELHAENAKGQIFDSAVVKPGERVADVSQSDTIRGEWLFRDVTTKLDGSPAHMFWDVANVQTNTIPTLVNPNRVNWRDVTFATGVSNATRVTINLRLEPVGLDVLDDLVESGHLSPTVRDALPRFTLIPKRVTSPDKVTEETPSFEWTLVEANGPKGKVGNGGLCLQSS